MTPKELADELDRMYHEAPKGETTTMVRLFGITFADEIGKCPESSVGKIVQRSSVPRSYVTEIHKGVRLAHHVVLRSARETPMINIPPPRQLKVTGAPGVISQGKSMGSAKSVSYCFTTQEGHTIHAELSLQQARSLVEALTQHFGKRVLPR